MSNTKWNVAERYLGDFFRKPTRPSLPLRKAPPLTPALSPHERGRKPPSGAQNRYAIRLADHQRSRQIVRDGTAWGSSADLDVVQRELKHL